ncbi:MAG: class I SAM-dependent methyltransferase, partial [Francisellaceae bacterium]|nr:class I SAM-dependent methyltransferase [Francisellaceae bacterium]
MKQIELKYKWTSIFYDVLDYPWERLYRKWRKKLLSDMTGFVLELGVGTGRNFAYYNREANVTGIDISKHMLEIAKKRATSSNMRIKLVHDDATTLNSQLDNSYDWVFSTFMFCVMDDELQPEALEQIARVLKPGGKFRILEMVYSKNTKLLRRQQLFSRFVEKVYGARFDRKTLNYINDNPNLELSRISYLKE